MRRVKYEIKPVQDIKSLIKQMPKKSKFLFHAGISELSYQSQIPRKVQYAEPLVMYDLVEVKNNNAFKFKNSPEITGIGYALETANSGLHAIIEIEKTDLEITSLNGGYSNTDFTNTLFIDGGNSTTEFSSGFDGGNSNE